MRWPTPLIPAVGRQKQEDFCEFEATLGYRMSSRTAKAVTKRNAVSKNKKKELQKDRTALVVKCTAECV